MCQEGGAHMQTLEFKAVIDERRILSLTLPADVSTGPARVTVTLEPGEPVKRPSPETVKALKAFHKGRRLDGMSLRELREEGRP